MFCGAGNVLVGCRLAQGRHVEHLLNRPLQESHLEETTALAADEYARVMVENDASKVYEASPWAADEQSYNRGSCLRRMDSAARMLSEDGGSSWSKCC